MAALETSEKMLETSCGSPHYASPEIVAGKSYHGAPSDIWSCGIILFALLTGHLPFDDDNIRKLLLKVQEGKFQMPPELSPHAKDLIWKMLRVDPDTRISMTDILKHSLLRKYPAKRSTYRSSPISADTVSRPVKSVHDVDPEILKNLQTLWHGADKDTILKSLLSDQPNSQKTFYCLLMKYRHDHSEISRKKKPSVPSTPTKQTTKPVGPNRHRRTPSATSSIRRHRGHHSRSRSRSRSRSQIVYHSHSNSKSSIISSATSKRKHHRRTRSIQTSSPPPPLPTEAVKMVEAAALASPPPWSDEANRNSADFASMLEQAFNFDTPLPTSYNYSARSASNPMHSVGVTSVDAGRRIVSEPTRHSHPAANSQQSYYDIPPKLSTSPLILPYTSAPPTPPLTSGGTTAIPSELLLPMIFEEGRFADAIEEEMDIHMKQSLDYNPLTTHSNILQTPPQKYHQSSITDDETFGSDLYKSLCLPEIPNTPTYNDPSLQQIHYANARNNNNRNNTNNAQNESFESSKSGEDSRLRISGMLKTESFKARSGPVRPKSMLVESSPVFNYNTKFNGSPQLQPKARHSDSKVVGRRDLATADPPRPRAVSAYERIITSTDSKPLAVDQPLQNKPQTTSMRGASLLRKFTLVPKRTAPVPPSVPAEKQPQSRVVSAESQATAVSSQHAKSRIVSQASTVSSSATTWKSSRPSTTPSTESADHGNSNGPKQSWFMKLLNPRRPPTETKGYYSHLPATSVRRLIMQILRGWVRYGISNISEDPTTSIIRAKISAKNVLKLGGSRFRIEIESHSVRSSYYRGSSSGRGNQGQMVTSIVVVQERGSTNSFLRFLGELEHALEDRNALVNKADDEGHEREYQDEYEELFEDEEDDEFVEVVAVKTNNNRAGIFV